MKQIVDDWGDPVKPYSLHMVLKGPRVGSMMQITDLAPDEDFPIGAVFEGGDPEEDGDYFRPDLFGFEIRDLKQEAENASDWRQEAFKLWCE